jgi:hypothetical protein
VPTGRSQHAQADNGEGEARARSVARRASGGGRRLGKAGEGERGIVL